MIGTHTPTDETIEKPRLLFFRILDTNLPEFIRGHFRDHLECLQLSFDVTLVSENADYDEAVDRVRPQLALFESGVYARPGRRIRNTHRHPEIPKVGFLDADAYCATRSVFLSDMDEWGVETFFGLAVSASGYTPELRDRLYAWPNFADRHRFRTHTGGKTQKILLSGSRASNYPWRVSIDRILRQNYPVRAIPHAGWFDRNATASMPTGDAYARDLSSAQIIPACGTIAEDVTRKHFEIPASGALLLTERTAGVEAAGFVDMENCVFADAGDVVERVDYLFAHPSEIDRIAKAGQTLAHTRHSIEHRDQLRQWFDLSLARRPGEVIVQPEPFGRLRLAPVDAHRGAVGFVSPEGQDRRRIRAGRALLEEGRPAAAAEMFAQVLNFHFEPEAGLGMARSLLRRGQAREAGNILDHSIALVLRGHGASCPDPVEWATFIRSRLCEGASSDAARLARAYPGLRHPELDRIRSVVGELAGVRMIVADRPRRLSVHAGAGDDGWEHWRSELVNDLLAGGSQAIARDVASMAEPPLNVEVWKPDAMLAARTRSRRLPRRIARRLSQAWSKLRGRSAQGEQPTIFDTFGGLQVDAVVLLAVSDDVASAVGAMVTRDPSAVTLVRVGVSPKFTGSRSRSSGCRLGLDPDSSGEIVLGGAPSILITETEGAEMLGIESLRATQVLVVVGGASVAAVDDRIWREADHDRRGRVAGALGVDDVQVWERRSPASAPDLRGRFS